jgi:uncharacterized protein YycO
MYLQTRAFKIKEMLRNKRIFILFILLFFCILGTYSFYPKSNILSTPSYLQIGDLLFCDYRPDFASFASSFNIHVPDPVTTYGPYNDHVALYIGNDMFIEACPYYYDTEEQAWIGVVTTHIGTFNLWATNISYGVLTNVTDEQREGAVAWAKNQLGQPYQETIFPRNMDPFDEDDPTSDHWFCSELIWAAYKHQGVHLEDSWMTVTPNSLLRDERIDIHMNEPLGFWYPGLYLQWYATCFFDYLLN